MNEADIIYESGRVWVYRDKRADSYVVFVSGVTHSVSDSAYPRTADGLTIATARADYLATRDIDNIYAALERSSRSLR